MKLFRNEKYLLIALTVSGVASIGASLVHLFAGLSIPGLEPLTSALFWAALWRWYVVKKAHPGGIYTLLYTLIILMNVYAGISQIWVSIR